MKSVLIEVADLAQEVLYALKPLAEARGIRLAARPPPVDILFRTDPAALSGILANLVDNAVRACRLGGLVELVWMREADGELIIVVDDEGDGCRRDIEATKELTQKVDGTINAEGEPEIGCRVTVRIPVHPSYE